MATTNLGYVKTGQDFGEGLAGIGALAEDVRTRKKNEAGRQALSEAWKTNDMDAIQQVAIDYPDLAPKIQELSNMRRFLEKDNLRNMALFAQEYLNEPDLMRREQMISDRIGTLKKQKRDPQDTQAFFDSPEEEREMQAKNTIRLAEQFGALDNSQFANGGMVQSRFVTDEGTVGYLTRGGEVVDTGVKVSEKGILTDEGLVFDPRTRQMSLPGQGGSLSREQILSEQKAERERQSQAAAQEEQLKAERRAAVQAGEEAAQAIGKLDRNIGNYNQALKALEGGARSGKFQSYLPSFRSSSIELDNIRNQLGLDVIGAATFGALSEAEMQFALSTALPDTKDPEALKDWIIRKRNAQISAMRGLRRAAQLYSQGMTKAQVLAAGNVLPPGVTEDDVYFTMEKHGLTYRQVLERLHQRKR